MEKRPYSPPMISALGSIADLTRQGFDKIGASNDAFTQLTGLDGTIVPD